MKTDQSESQQTTPAGNGRRIVLSATEGAECVVRVAASAADREAAYRLRYRVYVDELGFRQTHADHECGWVKDPLDESAILVVALSFGRVVGTVRTNFARECDLGPFVALHRMHETGTAFPSKVSLTSKLIVHPAYRSGRVASRMIHYIFQYAVARGIGVDFIDCEAKLVPLYHRYGYRQTSDIPFEHPELGPRIPMRLWTDVPYLARARSAFLRLPA
jgi:GNAT superfamily N-acetyltransferase